jgi:thiol:disulfide interchange protein
MLMVSVSQAFGPGHGSARANNKSGIVFEQSLTLQAAVARARQTGQAVFVDFQASWCGPCRQLKKTTFQDAAVAQFFNQQFVNLAVDVETGEGPVLAEQFEIKALPTLIILNSRGEVVGRTVGFQSADQLLAFARKALHRL